jgi:hypothetical protein
VQALLDAALKHDPVLQAVVKLLSTRLAQREWDVRQCFGTLYHRLSKELHGAENDLVVREVDFPACPERCAVCALLEAYAMPYTYLNAAGSPVSPSPYALSAAERLAAAAPLARAEAGAGAGAEVE